MLRNRDSFFQNQEMPNLMPYPFPNQNIINQPNNMEDYDNRLAKIERQINRLDARLNKLENANKIVSDDLGSSMYMV